MKKVLMVLLISLLCVFTACKMNQTVPNEGSVTLDLSENYKEYIHYDNIPNFVFNFDGTLNTIKNVNKSYYTVFSNNEDIILSDALKELFAMYPDTIYRIDNVDKVKTRYFTTIKNGKVENISMPCDNDEVYDEVAFVPLNNGLKLTIDYCRFVSDGITYYTWRYSASIAMFLYYPIMRIKNNGSDELVLLTLPNGISIHVSPELKLSNVMNKDDYLKDQYYTFEYYQKDNIDKKEYVWAYYEGYNLSERSDGFTFDYLNNRFSVELRENDFIIRWKERI